MSVSLDTRVFSPILESAAPAVHLINTADLIISYEVPKIINYENVRFIQLIITNQLTNKLLTIESRDYSNDYYRADSTYYIPKEHIINNTIILSEFLNSAYDSYGALMKIQIRFGYSDRPTKANFSSDKTTIANEGNFSEWSNVQVVKILRGDIGIDIIEPKINNGVLVTDSLMPEFKASCQFDAQNNEQIEQYSFTLKQGNIKIETSGWLPHLANKIEDSYKFTTFLEEDLEYIVQYEIISTNGYNASIEIPLVASSNAFLRLSDEQITVREVKEQAYNKIIIKNLKFLKRYVILRSSIDTDFNIWDALQTIQSDGADFIFNDFVIENGKTYKYGLQSIDNKGNYSPVKIAEGRFTNYFEYTYLVDKERQLQLKFDFKISSFKNTALRSKQDTLGSKYPVILQNGIAKYAEFPINGLISLNMDEESSFMNLELLNKNKKTRPLNPFISRVSHQNKEDVYNSQNLTNINYYLEKQFRDEVEGFLNNGKYKLFKSATEGNLLISLINVSLTPNEKLGRLIYSFSATAYQIADATVENYKKLGILDKDSFNSIDTSQHFIGSTYIYNNEDGKDINLQDALTEVVNQQWENYNITNINFIHIELINEAEDWVDENDVYHNGAALVTLDNQPIFILPGRKYLYPPFVKNGILNKGHLLIDFAYTMDIQEKEINYYYLRHDNIWGQYKIQASDLNNLQENEKPEIVAHVIEQCEQGYSEDIARTLVESRLNSFNLLTIEGNPGTLFIVDGEQIEIGKTGYWCAPLHLTPQKINLVSSPIHYELETGEIRDYENWILVNYQCIINSQHEIPDNKE